MADGAVGVAGACGPRSENDFTAHLAKYVGETVTIFTRSGGASGSGFTGVVLSVNKHFVRLITRIGPAPGCALGSACNGYDDKNGYAAPEYYGGNCGKGYGGYYGGDYNQGGYGYESGAGMCHRGLGSVTDIPIENIVAFVHNAV